MDCFSLEILIENRNTNPNFPLYLLIILVQNFLLLQNYFLKDYSLGKIFKKIFNENF